VWLEFSGERKKFLQGLIQLTVALHHLTNENRVGASRLLAAASEKLTLESPERELIDVDALLEAVKRLRERLQREIGPLPGWTPPRIHSKA
jgi:uncharacterized protein